MKTRLLTTALTAAALTTLPAASAHAQGAAPAPTPGCQGIQITDKPGDSANQLQNSQTGNPSTDLIAGFITYDGTKAFANIQVDNLTVGQVDPPYVAVGWEMVMTTTAGAKNVRAYVDRTGIPRWTWGTESDPTDPSTAGPSGTTTGTMFPGKNGIIQIELPLKEDGFGAKPGSVLKGLSIEVRQWASFPSAVPHTGLPLVFPAPIFDDASGKAPFTLTPCTAGSKPGPGAPGGPPAPAPEPKPPVSTDAGGSGGQGTAPSNGAFDVKITVPKLKASKLKKGKKFTVKLSGNATSLTAVLRKQPTGGKPLAVGKLATLKGKGKLTLKTKSKLKKGSYVLVIGGKNAQGQAAQGAVKVRVR